MDNAYDVVRRFELSTFDVSYALKVFDILPIKRFAMTRLLRDEGFAPDDTHYFDETTEHFKKYKLYQENVVDDFIVYTLNSFEFFFIARPELKYLTETERRCFVENTEAISIIYETVKLHPELAGCFVRYQRIGSAIFLITPTINGS